MGPRWLLFRIAYAARQTAGWDARRSPVSTWEAQPLGRFLVSGVPSEPAPYHTFRVGAQARFFLPACTPGDAVFSDWDSGRPDVLASAGRILAGEFQYFGNGHIHCGMPPKWHLDPFSGRGATADGHWSRIDEFAAGDIKLVWELNRFGFVFPLARAYWRTGDEAFARCFWELVEDWRIHNPPQTGPNWKCGQEASFRAMAWCFGLFAFGGASATSPEKVTKLAQMLAVTAGRIASNLGYALSQKNNHGISEAAGLWTVGTLFPEFRDASRWREMGRAALESQARELIYDDGGFSQHSVNYHRVMLDDYLWCIQLGRANGTEFSPELLRRVGLAGHWLDSQLDPESGRLPNWGANDGAQVLPLSNCGYSDFRPVAQLAAMVTAGTPVLPAGPWDEQAWWLGCPVDTRTPTPVVEPAAISRRDLPDSGLTLLRAGPARAILRTVRRFRHRPAHCDLLHLDLWVGTTNLLRDGGSFSYNAPDKAGSYFKSVAAHNTIQFDGHDQMPQLGRFLYGAWPAGDAECPVDDPFTVTGSYQDWQGCRHQRTVRLEHNRCVISDRMSGFQREAVLRWRLAPELDWELRASTCTSKLAVVRVTGDGARSRLSEGWESLFYNTKSPLRVFEASFHAGCAEIETEILFA